MLFLELPRGSCHGFWGQFLFFGRQDNHRRKKRVNWLRSLPLSFPSRSWPTSRHYSLDPGDRAKAFAPDTFRHGAGGSIGAIVYSGLPWDPKRGWIYESKTNGWKKTPSDDNGFFLDWMGALGTSVLMAFVLMGSLCVHFSMEPLKLLGALLALGGQSKNSFRKRPMRRKIGKSSGIEEKQGRIRFKGRPRKEVPEKRWKFSWLEKEKEDDLLFRDVSLQKESGAVTQSEISSSKKTKPKNLKRKRKTSYFRKNLRKLPNLLMTRVPQMKKRT